METKLTEAKLETQNKLLLGILTAGGTGALLWFLTQTGTKLSTADMVNPEAVTDIAASLPQNEDDFIMAARQYVSDRVEYQGYSSNLYFVNDWIKCSSCRLPETTLKLRKGNCVSMSSLLASILRNRLPPDRVFMVVGEARFDGIGGHAWVECQRQNGYWYLLESTNPPNGWIPVDSMRSIYEPFALFNDKLYNCYSDEICRVSVSSCDCRKIMLV